MYEIILKKFAIVLINSIIIVNNKKHTEKKLNLQKACIQAKIYFFLFKKPLQIFGQTEIITHTKKIILPNIIVQV